MVCVSASVLDMELSLLDCWQSPSSRPPLRHAGLPARLTVEKTRGLWLCASFVLLRTVVPGPHVNVYCVVRVMKIVFFYATHYCILVLTSRATRNEDVYMGASPR